MEWFAALGKWFWLVCILVTCLNGAIFWMRAKKRIQQTPDSANGYRTIIRGFVTWGNLPWVVMGVGCTIGGVPSVWHYFNPGGGNGYILAFFASVVLVWVLGSRWIFFRGGAQVLVDHPGIFNVDFKSPVAVKFVWAAILLGGIVAFTMMFTQESPVPGF